MNPAGVLLIATITFCAGRLSHYRTLRGQALELELARLRVDDVDQIVEVKDRWRDTARSMFHRIGELAQ